jgi:alpha-tubulin suppressor-like RCC1 family protein
MGASMIGRLGLASARARLIVLVALAALVCATVWAAQALSAGPSAGQLYAFGNNMQGQLGKATPMNDPAPTVVAGFPASAGAITSASAGGSHTLAVAASGTLYAFGDNTEWQLGNRQPSSSIPAAVSLPGANGGIVQAAAGLQFSFGLTASGQLYGFGGNFWGQLGTPTNEATINPVDPEQVAFPGGTGRFAQVATGSYHTLALGTDDKVYAWGDNFYGQVGNLTNQNTNNPNPTPADVTPTHTGRFTQIAAGTYDSFALTSTGEVFSWGDDSSGQLGRSTTPANTADATPDLVSFAGILGQITSLAAGGAHTLALSSTGQVFAFGADSSGQLGPKGNGTSINETPVPVSLPANSGPPVQIAAGSDFSFVLTSTGALYAFGDNFYGQLGSTTNNNTNDPNATPTQVAIPGGVNLDAVASGSSALHTLVIIAALDLATSTLPAGVTGAAYSAQPTLLGGRPPFSWTASGLPPGLAINAATGQISGTPAAAGSYTPTLGVTDANGIVDHAAPTLRVNSPGGTGSGSTTKTTTRTKPTLALPKITVTGPRATLTVSCAGSSGQRCAGAITGTSTEHLVVGKLVSVTAAKTKTKAKKKTARRVKLVNRRYTLAAGIKAHIAISLNKAGRALLDHFYSVPVKLAITNSGKRTTQKTTFRYGLIRAPIDYFWYFRPGYSFIGNLGAGNLRRSWHATLTCQGGGCPLKRTALKIRGGRTSATATLKGAHLRPGAIVQLTISGADQVAEVLRFTIVPNALPRTTALCQTPDQHAPGACTR